MKNNKGLSKTIENRIILTRSETWLNDNFEEIHSVLEDAIKEFISDDERIINIEVREHCGLKRFWIYSEKVARRMA